jgi:hypothetical protein
MHPITAYALAEEMKELAKEAAAKLPKWAIPAAIGATGAGTTVAGTALGLSSGKKTGRKEGLRTGLQVGGRAGYRAGMQKADQNYARHRQILSSLSELTQRHPEGVVLKRDEGGRIGYHLVGGKSKKASAFPLDLFVSLLS